MRERIAAAFVLLSVALIALTVTIRAVALSDFLREQEQAQQQRQADLLAAVVDGTVEAGRPVDQRLLDGLVDAESRLEYDAGDGAPVVAEGPAFDTEMGVIVAVAEAGDGSVELLTTARELSTAKAASIETLVAMQHPDWTEEQVREERRKILDDQGVVADPFTLR